MLRTPTPEEVLALAVKHWKEPTLWRGRVAFFGREQSKKLDLVNLIWHDFEEEKKGGWKKLYEHFGEPLPNGHDPRGAETIYPYRDEAGRLLFEVVRAPGHNFKQRRPNGNGGFIWNLNDTRRVLYRLPELLAADRSDPLYILEGEKDVDTATRHGLLATTNPGGAGKWNDPGYNEAVRGYRCILVADNDDAGRRHIREVAARIAGFAAEIITIDALPGVGPKGDLSDWIAQGHTVEELAALWTERPADPIPPSGLQPAPWEWQDPATIPPRPWLLGTALLRGYATLLGAPGGVGKTAWAIAACLAVITGLRTILGLHSFAKGAVWYITLEDDMLEIKRRIAAAMKQHNIDRTAVAGQLFVNHPDLRLLELDSDGAVIRTEHFPQIVDYIKRNSILLVVIDPLAKAHRVVENSNEHMDALMAAANELGKQSDAAILVPCHFRKPTGNGSSSDADQIRGGSALVAGARIALGAVAMTKDEAQGFGLGEDQVLFRITDAKANFAPKKAKGGWYELVSVALGNTFDPAYPDGDSVQAVKPWSPPDSLAGMTATVLAEVFEILGKEVEPGVWYSPSPQARVGWAGTVLMEVAGRTRTQTNEILRAWEKNKVFRCESYRNPARNNVLRIVLNPVKVAEMTVGA